MQPQIFSRGERRANGRVRLFSARGSVELGKVGSGSGSAMQGLWLGNRKVVSHLIGED